MKKQLLFKSSLIGLGMSLCIGSMSAQQMPAKKMGVNTDFYNSMVNMVDQERPWIKLVGDGDAAVDAQGWPTEDFMKVFWDYRSFFAWLGDAKIEDPDKLHIDMSGTWKLSFTGQADIAIAEGAGFTFTDKVYNANTNKTTVNVNITFDQAVQATSICALQFKNTKATANSAINTGLKNMRMIRPGYTEDTKEIFSADFVNTMCPFGVIRTMDATHTNFNVKAGDYFNSNKVMTWARRSVPGTPGVGSSGTGYPWEYVIELANVGKKDLWINIPVNADDNYITELAKLFKKTLNPNSVVYFEIGNEVWNTADPFLGATQWNQAAAKDEVAANSNSDLNTPGSNAGDWTVRRHFRRSKEASDIFKSVYGASAINTTIRPLCVWFTLQKDSYDATLKWMESKYGKPSNYIYGIGASGYYDFDGTNRSTVDDLIAGSLAAVGPMINTCKDFNALAKTWGLKFSVYEGSSNYQQGFNITNKIKAARDPRFKDVVKNALNEFGKIDADVFNYFAHAGMFSSFGTWSLLYGGYKAKDMAASPKYQGVLAATGQSVTTCYTPTSILSSNLENVSNVVVFPVPSKGKVTLQSSEFTFGITTATVFNTSGTMVVPTIQALQNNENIDLDLSSLDNGLYFVTLENQGRKLTKKVSIQK